MAGALAAGIAACGSSSSSGGAAGSSSTGTKTINLGAGSVKVGDGDLSIAFFSGGSTNAYLQSANSAARDAAKKAGVKFTFFDGNFDPTTETNQMEQALASGQYNGWAVESLSPNACSLVKQAIKKGVLVSVFNGPVCGGVTASGEKAWIPGSLNFVAGDQTYEAFSQWLDRIVKDNPGPQKMLVLEGPPAIAQTVFTDRAIAALKKSHPEIQVIAQQVPAYTLAGANTKTSQVLTANSDITIIAGNYSDLTLGALEAVKTAGKLGKIKIYDSGGSKGVVDAIKKGEIELTQPYLPATESVDAVNSIIDAWHGKVGPHYVNILDSLKGGQRFIDHDNAAGFRAQY